MGSLDTHLERGSDSVKAVFAALQDALADIGPHAFVPVKTMIVLRATANFANVVVRRDALNLEFVLTRQLTNARILKAQAYGTRRYAHHLRLTSAAEVDAQLKGWLRESYAIGARET